MDFTEIKRRQEHIKAYNATRKKKTKRLGAKYGRKLRAVKTVTDYSNVLMEMGLDRTVTAPSARRKKRRGAKPVRKFKGVTFKFAGYFTKAKARELAEKWRRGKGHRARVKKLKRSSLYALYQR